MGVKSAIVATAAVLFAMVILAPISIRAQLEFRTLFCQFSVGSSARFYTEWDANAVKDKLDFTFDGIDTSQAKARVVGPFGMTNVLLFRGNNSLNFLEIMTDGNQAFTTVFFSHHREGKQRGAAIWYPAVHSRHMMIGRSPVISHYRGYCQPS